MRGMWIHLSSPNVISIGKNIFSTEAQLFSHLQVLVYYVLELICDNWSPILLKFVSLVLRMRLVICCESSLVQVKLWISLVKGLFMTLREDLLFVLL